ncbi:MAG: hypothetical protein HQ478_09370 [Chloroflexi bacterium]|nr:hypothetical protein [Chloroflexota bacterium]
MSEWSWESLQATVQGVIDEGRIGKPVALRLTVHARGGASEAAHHRQAAETAGVAWFGGQPQSTYSIGGDDKPVVTALKWDAGQSAILSISAGPSGRVGGNVMLMGSRGTIYHDIDALESEVE